MEYSDKCSRFSKQNICKHKGKSSSFWMHNPIIIFNELKLTTGETLLDLGCGVGEYAINASIIVGETGTVYALDRNDTLIHELNDKAVSEGLYNVFTTQADITNELPLDDNCVDICLIATVLHSIERSLISNIFKEVRRVMRPSGRLFTIDCSHKDDSFGPPMSMRLTPEEIVVFAEPNGFQMIKIVDLGFNYMIRFDAT